MKRALFNGAMRMMSVAKAALGEIRRNRIGSRPCVWHWDKKVGRHTPLYLGEAIIDRKGVRHGKRD